MIVEIEMQKSTNLDTSNGENGVSSVLITGKMRSSTIVNCKINQIKLRELNGKVRPV